LAAIAKNWCALEYASAELRGDCKVVLAAIAAHQECGGHNFGFESRSPLEFASAELKADHEFMSAVVATDGCALQYAAAELKADCEFILAAIVQNDYSWKVLEFASARARSFAGTYYWDIGRGPLGCAQYSLAKERREDARGMGRLKDAAKRQKRVAKTERVRRMREGGSKLTSGCRKDRRTGWMLDLVADTQDLLMILD